MSPNYYRMLIILKNTNAKYKFYITLYTRVYIYITTIYVFDYNYSVTGKPGVLQSMGSQRVRTNSVTELTDRLGNPTSVFLPVTCYLEYTITSCK